MKMSTFKYSFVNGHLHIGNTDHLGCLIGDVGNFKTIEVSGICYFDKYGIWKHMIFCCYLYIRLFQYLNRMVNSLISIAGFDKNYSIRLVFERKDYDKVIKSINNYVLNFDEWKPKLFEMEVVRFFSNRYINEIYYERPYIIKAQPYLWKIERLNEFDYLINGKFTIKFIILKNPPYSFSGRFRDGYYIQIQFFGGGLRPDSPSEIGFNDENMTGIETINTKEILDTIVYKIDKEYKNEKLRFGMNAIDENRLNEIISIYHDVMQNIKIFDEEYKLEPYNSDIVEEEII